MAKHRFKAPARALVPASFWEAPIYADFHAFSCWLRGPEWPSVKTLNSALEGRLHAMSGHWLQFVEQTPELLSDGLHFEQRSFERGQIATRPESWHDLFNALVWISHTELKCAINARQAADVEQFGGKRRSRAQCALTHFDEAGAIVLLRDERMLRAWDRHDWPTLFRDHGSDWQQGDARVLVVGHALLEHGLVPTALHTAKCLVAVAEPADSKRAVERIVDDIASGSLLTDPQELRPLPLSGLPGWHAYQSMPDFFQRVPCFRPLREGRVYPDPVRLHRD